MNHNIKALIVACVFALLCTNLTFAATSTSQQDIVNVLNKDLGSLEEKPVTPSTSQQGIVDFLNSWVEEKKVAGNAVNVYEKQPEKIDEETMKQVCEYLDPPDAEIEQLFEYVRASPVVRQNPSYVAQAKDIVIVCSDNPTINAYATVDNEGKKIVFFAGEKRFSRLIALTIAAEIRGDSGAAQRFVDALDRPDWALLNEKTYIEIFNDASLVPALCDSATRVLAKKLAAGATINTLGHETGHILLGHVYGPGYNHQPDEISRNQEREADLFASSVTAASPFGEYILVGTISKYAFLSCKEAGNKESTHPLSKERVANAIRQNASLLKQSGVNVE